MEKQPNFEKKTIMFLSFLLMLSILVGICFAQSNSSCPVGSGQEECESGDVLPSDQTGYIYEVCAGMQCVNITLAGEALPGEENVSGTVSGLTAQIISPTANTFAFGSSVGFAGKTIVPQGSSISSYEWASNIDGVLSDQITFSTDQLSIGEHKISFTITDDTGKTAEEKMTLTISPPEFGNPVKVIPRIVTAGSVVRAYNVPAVSKVSNIPICKATPRNGVAVKCSAMFKDVEQPAIESCPGTKRGTSSPVLELVPQEADKIYDFEIGTQITKKAVVKTGSIAFTIDDQKSTGEVIDLGTKTDIDFYPNGLVFGVETSEEIKEINSDNFANGVFYSLYKVENCTLKQIYDFQPLQYFDPSDKKSFTGILGASDCEPGETCKYAVELIALGSAGGQLLEFSWARQIGAISADPSTVELSEISAGSGSSAEVTITNSGADTLTNLQAAKASSRLTLSLDKNTLEPGDSATLSVKVNVERSADSGDNTDYINLKAATGGKTTSALLPVTYSVAAVQTAEENEIPVEEEQEGSIVPTPSTVNFGTVKAGDAATQVVAISNPGARAVNEITILPPEEITATPDSIALLGAGDSTSINLVLTVPLDAAEGPASQTIDIVAADGTSATIAVTYTIGAETVSCPTIPPPECGESEHLESQTDDEGCTFASCAPDAVTGNEGTPLSEVPEEGAQEIGAEGGKGRHLGIGANEISTLQIIIIVATVAIGAAFILLIIAFRARWLDLEKYPFWKKMLPGEKRFIPPPPPPPPPRPQLQPPLTIAKPTQLQAAPAKPTPPQPPTTLAQKPPAQPQYTPEQLAKLEAYMKKHPEYADYIKKRYGLV